MNPILLIHLTQQDLVDRYAGSALGAMWAFIWPLVNILIFTLIFSQLMGAKLPASSTPYNYSIYLISGLLTWNAFANTVLRATSVFVDKRPIITKVKLQLPHLPLYIVLSETITLMVGLIFFVVFLLIIQAPISPLVILVPFIVLTQQILAYAIGLLGAIFYVFSRDMKEIIGISLQVWFWLTPIVYVATILPDTAKQLLFYNPIYGFVSAYQNIFLFGQLPDMNWLINLAILTHLLLMGSYLLFKKLEKDIRDFL